MEPLYLGLPMTAVALLGAHALADYPLQGPFLSEAKNPRKPIPGVPWWQAMSAHAGIHGALVALVTGVWWLALPEFVIHFATDHAKCSGRLSFDQDQFIHVMCKLWALVMAWAVAAHGGLI